MDSKTVKSYRDLLVWQRSIQLSVAVYRLTGEFPREELYGLTSQLRRAAVSVASNIAEGYGRGSKGEYTNFLGIARGSVLEVQTQLVMLKSWASPPEKSSPMRPCSPKKPGRCCGP